MVLQWCEDAASYVKELTSEGKPNVDYVLFSLEDAKKKNPRMELLSMGKGGRAKVVEELLQVQVADSASSSSSDKVITGAFLASAVDERGSVVAVRRKYIHVIWVGTGVGIMVKGKVNTSLTQPFKDQFPGCALYLQLSDGDADDLIPKYLEKTLMASGGGDTTRYSFTNRTLIGSLSMDESSFNNSNDSSSRRREPVAPPPKAALKKTAQEEEEEARRKAAEVEARRKAAEEEARRIVAAEEARRQAEEDARQKARDERQKFEEEARRAAEEERRIKLQADEDARKAKEEAARRKADEEEEARKAAAIPMTPKAALGDKSLIMLISSMSGNMTTSTNQALAERMLTGLEVAPKIIDGAIPENKEIRNELFGISGLRGNYPQFFLRQKDGTLKFFGDFETLTQYNDTGLLAQQIGGCATPRRASLKINNQATAFAAVGSTLNGSKLLLLISTMSGSLEVSANQSRVEAILKGLHLPKEELDLLDGCNQSLKERRNELFGISGIRAKYPQLFLVTADGKTSFVGNIDDINYLHDTNTLAQAIGLESKAAAAPVALSTLPHGNKLVLLISSMSGSMEVSANQSRVEGILKGLHLSKAEIETMDGCDPSIKERRNELFGISGIRAKYPQLFLMHGKDGSTHFVGNFDEISYLHDTNTLAQSIGLVSIADGGSKAAATDSDTTAASTVEAPTLQTSGTHYSEPPKPEQIETPQKMTPTPVETPASTTATDPPAKDPPVQAVELEPVEPESLSPPDLSVDTAVEPPVSESDEIPNNAADEAVIAEDPPAETPALEEVQDESKAPGSSGEDPGDEIPAVEETEVETDQSEADVVPTDEGVSHIATPNQGEANAGSAEVKIDPDEASAELDLEAPLKVDEPGKADAEVDSSEPLADTAADIESGPESGQNESSTPESTDASRGEMNEATMSSKGYIEDAPAEGDEALVQSTNEATDSSELADENDLHSDTVPQSEASAIGPAIEDTTAGDVADADADAVGEIDEEFAAVSYDEEDSQAAGQSEEPVAESTAEALAHEEN